MVTMETSLLLHILLYYVSLYLDALNNTLNYWRFGFNKNFLRRDAVQLFLFLQHHLLFLFCTLCCEKTLC